MGAGETALLSGPEDVPVRDAGDAGAESWLESASPSRLLRAYLV